MSTAFESKIKGLHPRKHYFNLSYDNKFSCDMGQLIPVMCEEVLPSDHIKVGNEVVVRLQPLNAPMLQTIEINVEMFFVPNRLLDDNWEDFITGGKDGKNAYALPLHDEYWAADAIPDKYSLWDYFGLPLVKSNETTDPDKESLPIDYPWRAYNLVYNEYYRDENVIDEVDLSQGDVLCRCWSKDYFTSALPFQQRGDQPAFVWDFNNIFDDAHVEFDGIVPVQQYNNVTYHNIDVADWLKGGDSPTPLPGAYPWSFSTDTTLATSRSGSVLRSFKFGGDPIYPSGYAGFNNDSVFDAFVDADAGWYFGHKVAGNSVQNDSTGILGVSPDGSDVLRTDSNFATFSKDATFGLNDNHLVTDSSGDFSVQFNISELRENFQLQKYLERNARGGYRYVEQLYSRFGVKNGDLRLQRPHYLGRCKQAIMVSEIPQTGESGTTPQGHLAGKGLGAMVSKALCNYRVKEHGYILGLFSIMPKTSYASQGINKHWLKRTKFDYFTPEFAHLSENQILMRELYYTGDASSDLQPFGYRGIYDEYRKNRSIVTSDFRDTFSYWHMARQFSNAPALNADFLTVDPNATYLKAPFAVQNEKNFLVDYVNIIHAVRPLPVIAEPGLVDHF